MKATLVTILASAIVGLTSASGAHRHRHAQLHELFKRGEETSPPPANETCGCTTIYSTYYGEATLVPAPVPHTTTTTTTTQPPKPTTTKPPPPPPPATTAAPAYVAKKKAPAPKPKPVAPVMGGGDKWAMTYTPYTGSGQCKDAAGVMADVKIIASKGFSVLRVYRTADNAYCNILAMAHAACKATGMKMIVGIWINSSGTGGAQQELNNIVDHFHGDYSQVELVLVGNEVLAQGLVGASDLAQFIKRVRSTLRGAGYSGPVSTADTIGALQTAVHTPGFCDSLDVMTANIHAFFNPNTPASSAGDFVAQELQLLQSLCPGNKPAWCTESGWPSQGQANGAAVPGPSQQAAAISSIHQKVGSKVAFFSFGNDYWKGSGAFGVESYFGCSTLFD